MRQIGAVFAVLEELLLPLDEAVRDSQRVGRRCECVVTVGACLREVTVKPGVDRMKLLTHCSLK